MAGNVSAPLSGTPVFAFLTTKGRKLSLVKLPRWNDIFFCFGIGTGTGIELESMDRLVLSLAR
jgi:hypothetical protein